MKDDGVDLREVATLDFKSTAAPAVLGALVIGTTRLLAPEFGLSPIRLALVMSSIFALVILASNHGPWSRLLFWPILTCLIFNSATGSESLRNTIQPTKRLAAVELVAPAAAQEKPAPTPDPWGGGNPWKGGG